MTPAQLVFNQSIPNWISDFWLWFSTGQNATATGVVTATVVNAFTAYVLVRTLRAVNRQAIAADRQAQAAEAQAVAARKQAEVAEQQTTTSERAAHAAEEQVKAANASATVSEAQRSATEDGAKAERAHSELIRLQILAQLRPVLVLGRRLHQTMGSALIYFIQNHGTGVAFNIRVELDSLEASPCVRCVEIPTEVNVLGPNQESALYYNRIVSPNGKIQTSYESLDGRHFVTTVEVEGGQLRNQKPFEVGDEGGWIADPSLPPPL